MFFVHKIYERISEPQPKLEPFILENKKYSYEYSKNVLKKRWKRYEDRLLYLPYNIPSDIRFLCLYIKNVIKKRWKIGENKILEICENVYFGEKIWMKNQFDPSILVFYSKYVIKGRWKEIEKYIIKSNQIINYLSLLKNESDIKEFKLAVKLAGFSSEEKFSKNFYSWKPTHKLKISGKKEIDVILISTGKKLSNHVYQYYPKNFQESEYNYRVFQSEEWLTHAQVDEVSKKNVSTYFLISETPDGKKVLYQGKGKRKSINNTAKITPINV
jgi:hypothetical protein